MRKTGFFITLVLFSLFCGAAQADNVTPLPKETNFSKRSSSGYVLAGPFDVAIGQRKLHGQWLWDYNVGFKYYAWTVPAICPQFNELYCLSERWYVGVGLQLSWLMGEKFKVFGGPLLLPDVPLTVGYRFPSAHSTLFWQMQVFPLTTIIVKDARHLSWPRTLFDYAPAISVNVGFGF